MNLLVRDSLILKNSFDINVINISYAKNISDFGSIRIRKFILFGKYYFELICKLILKKYGFVYFQISPHGIAFFRDLLFVLLLKLGRVNIVYHLHGKGIEERAKKK